MIKISKDGCIKPDGWDFPIEEMSYLLEEHDGESFVLKDGRLYEKGTKDLSAIKCPVCNKEIKALAPSYDTELWEYHYVCNNCGMDITIIDVENMLDLEA